MAEISGGSMSDSTLIESESVYEGSVVALSVDRVRLPNGHETRLEIIRHRGAAAVVPLDEQGRVLLVRQYRYATDGWLLEIPAGKLDGGEPPEVCARREVEEEIGRRPRKLTPMGWIWTTPGFTDEKIWLFLATDLETAEQKLDDHEVLTVTPVALDDAVEMAGRGDIVDAKSICGLLRAARFLESIG